MENENILTQEELNDKLRRATYSHDYAEARRLVNIGADPNTLSVWGSPFVYWCSEKGKIDLIDLALEKGADINATNKNGETALHKAAYIGKVEIIDHLVDRGANLNQKTIYDATPLFVAVLGNQPESVKKLLCRGADPSIKDHNGVSAAQKAKEVNGLLNPRPQDGALLGHPEGVLEACLHRRHAVSCPVVQMFYLR